MKTLFGIFFTLVVSIACQAQQTNKVDSCFSKLDSLTGKKVYIDKIPMLDGNKNFLSEIMKRLKPKSEDVTLDSKVVIAFVIDEKGKVSGKRIIQGKGLAQQVLDLLDDLAWKPATCNGITVPALYLLPINIHFEK